MGIRNAALRASATSTAAEVVSRVVSRTSLTSVSRCLPSAVSPLARVILPRPGEPLKIGSVAVYGGSLVLQVATIVWLSSQS